MLRKGTRNFIIMLTLLALLTSGCSMRQTPADPDQPVGNISSSQQTTDTQTTPDQSGDQEQLDPASGTDLPNFDYPASPSDLPTQETPDPNAYMGPDLSERERVSDDFFDDAVFFGNSLVNGLELYGQMQGGDFCAATSASVISVTSTRNATLKNGSAGTMLEKMLEKQYGKIYILLGINEIGFNTDYFAEIYSDMLDTIKQAQPDAAIYIMSLTPVTKAKSDAGAPFTMERIHEYNQALYQLAVEHECYYLDLVEALADSTGYLPAADSTDGVHFVVSKYPVWADYLRTHYAGDPDDVKHTEETGNASSQGAPPAEEDPQPSEEPQPEETTEPETEPEETPVPGTGSDLVPQD